MSFFKAFLLPFPGNKVIFDTITKIVSSHGRGLQRITMEQMQSFFYIIFFGLTLATVGFTIEMFKSRKMSRESKKMRREGMRRRQEEGGGK